MAAAGGEVSSRVQLVEATPADEATLANLLELYVHEFSDFLSIDIGPDGRFGYPSLSRYWSDLGKRPFLVKVSGSLAGFVLVQQGSQVSGSDSVWDIAEFFVLRGYRRRGIGSAVARTVWMRFPGSWEVRVLRANRAAYVFWERAIAPFAGEPRRFEHSGEHGMVDVFAFEVPPQGS
jgi:predicted acetyltransferase